MAKPSQSLRQYSHCTTRSAAATVPGIRASSGWRCGPQAAWRYPGASWSRCPPGSTASTGSRGRKATGVRTGPGDTSNRYVSQTPSPHRWKIPAAWIPDGRARQTYSQTLTCLLAHLLRAPKLAGARRRASRWLIISHACHCHPQTCLPLTGLTR